MLESGQILAGRYGLSRRLADGRVTEAWLAHDRGTGDECVLKVLVAGTTDERAAFLAAARLQQAIRHPRVQPCLAVHDGTPAFAVFPALPGDASRLRGRPWTELVHVLRGVADALAALHAQDLVHRDLKPANVLIGDDGEPLLADFGLAARVGDAAALAGGSPYSMSPQQREDQPPASADDVYAYGALAYELLSGYPPHYPVAATELVPGGEPAPFAARLGAPAALERLVRRCLAQQPQDRPSAAEVADTLRTLAPDTGAVPSSAERRRVELRPPPASEAPIAPAWRPAGEVMPEPSALRSEGFRRGLMVASLGFLVALAGFVFFGLPRVVAQRGVASTTPLAPASTPAAAPAPRPPAPDLQKIAEAQRAFDELRPVVARRFESLEVRGAGRWDGEEYARGRRQLADADAAYGRREMAAALELLRASDASSQAAEKLAAPALAAELVAGAAAIEAGDALVARKRYSEALRIDPDSARAKRGLERAGTLDEVRRLVAEGAAAERDGRPDAAVAAYRKALALDRDTRAASEGVARVQGQAAESAYASAVSAGLEALARKDYAGARTAFERAGRLRPGAPEVTEGLAQVERALGDRTIGAHLAAAQAAEREEHWSVALAEYRSALVLDRNLLPAQQGVEHVEPRAMLDAELASYAERPERLLSSEVRAAARSVLERARAVPSPGPVLKAQMAAVERAVVGAETPMRVALASDNLTEVTIHRVGRLGTFERKDMELLPGRYTVVGVRAGYRDVRRQLDLLPGREAPPPLTIRCEEPI
ncbi:MAG: serine/threonine-protein kinase [Lysobacterales bacterium]|jgi:tetratricopeptide (TPR) repeat protein|nr:MAG: serine/threonine-protein kinase [Xanthomonadales bacterium]